MISSSDIGISTVILDLSGLGDKSEDESAGRLKFGATSISLGADSSLAHGLSDANFQYCLSDNAD
jgi:hypothetical protein